MGRMTLWQIEHYYAGWRQFHTTSPDDDKKVSVNGEAVQIDDEEIDDDFFKRMMDTEEPTNLVPVTEKEFLKSF